MQRSADMDEREAVQTLFQRLAVRGPEPSLQRINGTWQFDIGNCGRWYVTVSTGSITVSRNPTPADCAVSCSAEDFLDVLEGRGDMVTTFLRGRLRVTGDAELALSFRRLLPVVR